MTTRAITIFAVIVVAVSLATHATPAAREYPRCARYDTGSYNCGFATFQQCQATISGAGGICERNPRVVALIDAPGSGHAKRTRAHARY